MADRPKETVDGEYVVCPWCGYQHGDAWEHCTDEIPVGQTCHGCERRFEKWAVYDVQYHARPIREPSDG